MNINPTEPARKTGYSYKRWLRVHNIKRDLDAAVPWKDICKRNRCSIATVSYAKNLQIPLEYLALIEGKILEPPAEIPKQILPKLCDKNLNAIEFCEDSAHLNLSLFPSQRIILKAFYGISLKPDELKKVKGWCADGKCTWKGEKKYRELVLVCGMKSGKTALGGMIALIEEFNLYRESDFRKLWKLPPGKQVMILNVASNEEQAKRTVFAEIETLIKNAPYYQRRSPPSSSTTSFDFKDLGVLLQSGHSNSNALVGPTCKAVLMDELDRFSAKDSGRSSSKQMYASITRNVTPFGLDGKIISLSSPMTAAGQIMSLFEKSKNEETMLGFWLPTWEMNPNLPLDGAVMQAELRKSPEDFWRDYGAQPALTSEKYYRDRDRIDKIFERGRNLGMVSPIRQDGAFHDWFRAKPGCIYHLHLDPSVKNDSFGICMAHSEGKSIIGDLIYRFRPDANELDYEEIKQFLLLLADRFPTIQTVTYDIYMAVSLYQALQSKLGIESELFEIGKKIHDRLKIEAVYPGRLITYPQKHLRTEMRDLELINGRKVDHPDENEEGGKGTKDIVDALAGAVHFCLADALMTPGIACVSTEPDTGRNDFEKNSILERISGEKGAVNVLESFESEPNGRRSLIW